MGRLDGNVTLITGGGSGLGRAIVRRFIDEGASVAVLEHSADKGAALESAFGDAVRVVLGDVTTSADNERAVSATIDAFGRLDTFIGNAGLWDFNAALEASSCEQLEEGFDQIFGVNVKGYVLGARASVTALRDSKGSMIFTLSNAAFLPGGGGPLYVASKHAGVGLVRQLAYELEGAVRVNAVAPGFMVTDLRGIPALGQEGISLGAMVESMGGPDALEERMGHSVPTPDDYVAGYVLLASAESRTTTGTVLEMHGMLGAPPRDADH
jgi:2,3-dihydroxy-2,3-dihydrophenylpropionate dehydrogenase/cis-2,3-dihydrobiphenyl-2,3-diol dehydrogenase